MEESIDYQDCILLGTGFFSLNQIIKTDNSNANTNKKVKFLTTKLEKHGNIIGDFTIW